MASAGRPHALPCYSLAPKQGVDGAGETEEGFGLANDVPENAEIGRETEAFTHCTHVKDHVSQLASSLLNSERPGALDGRHTKDHVGQRLNRPGHTQVMSLESLRERPA